MSNHAGPPEQVRIGRQFLEGSLRRHGDPVECSQRDRVEPLEQAHLPSQLGMTRGCDAPEPLPGDAPGSGGPQHVGFVFVTV